MKTDNQPITIETIVKELNMDLTTLFDILKGQFIYVIYNNEIYSFCGAYLQYTPYGDKHWIITCIGRADNYTNYYVEDFNKTWFRTKEEAEKALIKNLLDEVGIK